MPQSAEELWHSTPQITRFFACIMAAVTLLPSLGVISVQTLALQLPDYTFPQLALYRFELWRFLTPFVFQGTLGGPGSLMVIFNIVFFMMWLSRLENGEFKGRRADLVFFLIFIIGVMILIAHFLLSLYFLGMATSCAMVWLWTRLNPTQSLSIFGYISVSAVWFPWALVVLHAVFGQSPVMDLVGFFVGHLYFYLHEILPRRHNIRLLWTPQILKAYLPDQRFVAGFQAYAPSCVSGALVCVPGCSTVRLLFKRPSPCRGRVEPPPPRTTHWGGRGRVLGS